MSPADQPAPPAQEPDSDEAQGSGGGSAQQLVSSINSQLMQLMKMLAQSPSAQEDDMHALAQVLQGFRAFVDHMTGGGQGQGGQGMAPPEAGSADVKPAM